jgi:hypothetical protein
MIVPGCGNAAAPISTLMPVGVAGALGSAQALPNIRIAPGSKFVPTTAMVTAVLAGPVLGVIEVKVGLTLTLIWSGLTVRGVKAILI